MIFKNKNALKITTILMAILMFSLTVFSAIPALAEKDNVEAYSIKSQELIQNIYDKFIESKGEVSASSNSALDGFSIFEIKRALIDVETWKYEDKTVDQSIDALIIDAINKEANSTTAADAKHLAHLYLAATELGKASQADELLAILIERQNKTENGGFVDGDYSEYSNLPAFDILATTNNLDKLVSKEKALEYILSINMVDSDFPDFMTINQIARVLKSFRNNENSVLIDKEINKIVDWIKIQQKEDGSFVSNDFDVPAVNTAEVVFTSKTIPSLSDETAIEFLLQKDDYKESNIGVNTWALRALLLKGAKPNIDPTKTDQETGADKESIKVYITLIDDQGKLIYNPELVTLEKDDKYGLTALGVLDKANVNYAFGGTKGFVEDINGIKNIGLNGWMYGVNGQAPEVSAIEKEVKDGDKVLWFYSNTTPIKVPNWPADRKTFTDVGANIAGAKDSIELLAGQGIIDGTGNNKFEPSRSINRAEFAKLVVETLGDKAISGNTGTFSDVDSTKWYADYIDKAFALALIEGSNGKFRPLDSITRNEVAVILHRMGNKVAPNVKTINFTDATNIPDWAKKAVEYAVEKELLKGYDGNLFKGNQPMTRAEVAVVLHRYIQMKNI